jgi:hypothetical protein
MVLIAALGLGLMVGRSYVRSASAFSYVVHDPLSPRAASPWAWAYACVPPLLAVSLVLWPLRLIPPRPRFLRIVRLPGLVPALVAWLALVVALAKSLLERPVLQRVHFPKLGYLSLIESMSLRIVAAKDLMGPAIAVSWLILWLGGGWRPERSWIDRAGRLLGVVWIVFGIVNWVAAILAG